MHGITIKNKKTGEIVQFIKCSTGRSALCILSGLRINLDHKNYIAEESVITEEQYEETIKVKP